MMVSQCFLSVITKEALKRYQQFIFCHRKKDKHLSFDMQKKHLSSVKAYFAWLLRENYILYDPSTEIDLHKTEKRTLTCEEVEIVLNDLLDECIQAIIFAKKRLCHIEEDC